MYPKIPRKQVMALDSKIALTLALEGHFTLDSRTIWKGASFPTWVATWPPAGQPSYPRIQPLAISFALSASVMAN
jgi:hypothetical protein